MMDKLISQQAAVNAVSEITTTMSVCTNKDECCGMKRMQKQAITELENLPSAEPESISEWKKEFREYVDSLDIARDDWKGIIEYIDELPSAQPEIIRCKDCEYGEQDEVGRWFCRSLGCQIGNEDGSGYCADALNRKEGAKDD